MRHLQTLLLLQNASLEAFILCLTAHTTWKVHLIVVLTQQFNAPRTSKCWRGFSKGVDVTERSRAACDNGVRFDVLLSLCVSHQGCSVSCTYL